MRGQVTGANPEAVTIIGDKPAASRNRNREKISNREFTPAKAGAGTRSAADAAAP